MDNPVNGSPAPQEKAPASQTETPVLTHAVFLHGDRVEVCAEFVARMRLCPRDNISLACALICAVADIGNEQYPEHSPFRHIKTSPEERNPFKTAIAVLQEVDSWGNGGAEPPNKVEA